MPTAKPRISVTLDPSTAEILRRAAKVQGQSVSKLVGEMCTELAPGLERVAKFGEAFQASTLAQRESIRAGMNGADDVVHGLVQEALVAMTALDEAVTRAIEVGD